MRLFVTIILILQTITGYNQVEFESDVDKTPLFSTLTPKIKELNQDFDFQLRFWQHEGMFTPAYRRLFTMTLKNGKWSCNSYLITIYKENYTVKKKKIRKVSGDSIWSYFMENNVLQLPDMKLLAKDFYKLIKPKIHEPILPPRELEDSLLRNNSIDEVEVVGKGRQISRILVADGVGYSLELLSEEKYKRIVYSNPLVYAEEYNHIPELQNFSNILKKVNEIWGVNQFR